NRVAQDLSFMSSGELKISNAERPSTPRTASAHSLKRGPRTGWARYALASATLLIEYRWEVELNPSPSNCGKMYHIQCDYFRPLLISPSACSKSSAGTCTKRFRLCGSDAPAGSCVSAINPPPAVARQSSAAAAPAERDAWNQLDGPRSAATPGSAHARSTTPSPSSPTRRPSV